MRPDESDEAAAARFRALIDECVGSRSTRINDAFHLLRHA
jgi:hypothetical protein